MITQDDIFWEVGNLCGIQFSLKASLIFMDVCDHAFFTLYSCAFFMDLFSWLVDYPQKR